MKILQKFLISLLITTGLIATFQISANASVTVNTKPGATMSFKRYETGKVVINSDTHPIYDSSVKATGIYYYPGESFTYDSVYSYYYYTQDEYNFASYVSTSGIRRFVLTSYDQGLGKRYVPGLTIY